MSFTPSAVAVRIYNLLRTRVPNPRKNALITYGEVSPVAGIGARALGPYLGELVNWCRANDLPAISALVVRQETSIPGDGYYAEAHGIEFSDDPRAAYDAWEEEVDLVCKTTYPTM